MSESVNRPGRPNGTEERSRGSSEGASRAPASSNPDRPGAALARGVEGFGFMMDVPVSLTVELGRRSVKIGEVLRLGPGSILELDKTNGEPLDIYVNNRLIARGEAVVVGERYGVRLTEVVLGDLPQRGTEEP